MCGVMHYLLCNVHTLLQRIDFFRFIYRVTHIIMYMDASQTLMGLSSQHISAYTRLSNTDALLLLPAGSQ